MTGQFDQMRKGTTTVAILKLLADDEEPLHGYEIIRRLHRMERDGLLESRWLGETGTRRRKMYTITEKGRRQLEAELEQWETLRQGMSLLLGLEHKN